MEKKYELTDDVIRETGGDGAPAFLYRIKALRDFECRGTRVHAGDLGGYVESEDNLSHEGSCWVFDDAKVYDSAKVYGDACVLYSAEVSAYAEVYDQAVVGDYAVVSGLAKVYGIARVFDSGCVLGHSDVSGAACVSGTSTVDDSIVSDSVYITGDSYISKGAVVRGSASVRGDAIIYGDAIVEANGDFIVFHIWWSDKNERYTWTRSNNKWNDWHGAITAEEMIAKGYEDSPASGKRYEEIVRYVNEIRDEEQ